MQGPHGTLSKAATPGPEDEVWGLQVGDVRGSSRDTLGSADLASSHPGIHHIADDDEEEEEDEEETFSAGEFSWASGRAEPLTFFGPINTLLGLSPNRPKGKPSTASSSSTSLSPCCDPHWPLVTGEPPVFFEH